MRSGVDPHPLDTRREHASPAVSTVTEAAQRPGVRRSIVASWITGGKLPAILIAGRRHVRPADLLRTQATVHLGTVVPAWRPDPWHAGRRLHAPREAAGLSQLDLDKESAGGDASVTARW